MSYERSERPVLKPMTIRFSEEAWDAIEDVAWEHGTNKTERIVDEVQTAEIKELIKALFDEISAVRIELNRIGVNYNQAIRLKQIERKYANKGLDVNAISAQYDETEKVKSECKGFSKEDMDALISRYETATKQVGEILCRILA